MYLPTTIGNRTPPPPPVPRLSPSTTSSRYLLSGFLLHILLFPFLPSNHCLPSTPQRVSFASAFVCPPSSAIVDGSCDDLSRRCKCLSNLFDSQPRQMTGRCTDRSSPDRPIASKDLPCCRPHNRARSSLTGTRENRQPRCIIYKHGHRR